MLDKVKFRLSGLSGGVLLSLLAHGLIVAALLIDWPKPVMQAEPEEQVVTVTLVAPPEPEPELPEPEQPEPEQPEPEQPAPEPEAPAPEEQPPEEPAPEQPAPQAAAPEPMADEADAGEDEGAPIPVLRPVFQFGEEDTGPEIAQDGGASEAPVEDQPEGQPEAPVDDSETQALEQPPAEELPREAMVETPPPEPAAEPDSEAADATEADPQPADAPQDEPPADPAPTLAMPDDITLPDAELAGDTPGALAEAASETELASLPENPVAAAVPVPLPRPANPSSPDTPAVTDVAPPVDTAPVDDAGPADPGPADTEPADAGPTRDNGLPGVRQLSSSVNTGHAVATTAMRDMPREARGSQLCTTELREQLRRAPEPYRLELLPSYVLPGGTVLTVPNAAFRAGGVWYDLTFRCTVDADAIRVVDFSFKVGNAIPRSQWQARGFPAY